MTHDFFIPDTTKDLKTKPCQRCGIPFNTMDNRVNYCHTCYLKMREVNEE